MSNCVFLPKEPLCAPDEPQTRLTSSSEQIISCCAGQIHGSNARAPPLHRRPAALRTTPAFIHLFCPRVSEKAKRFLAGPLTVSTQNNLILVAKTHCLMDSALVTTNEAAETAKAFVFFLTQIGK